MSGKNYYKLGGIYVYESYSYCEILKVRIRLCNVIDLILGIYNVCKCIICKVYVIYII